MTLAEGEPLQIESEVFKSHGLTPGHFKQEGRDRATGARRPLRVLPADVKLAAGVDEHGAHITVAFTLPAVGYGRRWAHELSTAEPDEQPGASVFPARGLVAVEGRSLTILRRIA